jgi:hypothetical protein
MLSIIDDSASSPHTMSLTGTSANVTTIPGQTLSSNTPVTLNSANTTYQLSGDISCPGSCFLIAADNISFNLNGHTITYDTAGGSNCRFGIYASAPWDSFFSGGCASGNPTSDTSNKFSVYNGNIFEGNCTAGSDNFIGSSAILTGGSNDLANWSIFNLGFNWCSDSAQAIYVRSTPTGFSIHDNFMQDRVVTAVSRGNYQGVAIQCAACRDANTPGADIFNNTLIGGPQGFAAWSGPGVQVHNNNISQGNPNGMYTGASPGTTACGTAAANPYTNAAGTQPAHAGNECTNDFGVLTDATNGATYNNLITPLEGRGLFLGCASGCTTGLNVHDNVVNAAVEFPNNVEYQGCEEGGAWGVEFRDGAKASTLQNNTIIIQANNNCGGAALRTRGLDDYNDKTIGNTFIALRTAGGVTCTPWPTTTAPNCAFAFSSLITASGSVPVFQFTSEGDTFQGDSGDMFFDSDTGTNEAQFNSPTFIKPATADPNYWKFVASRQCCPGGPVQAHVRDAIFGPGVSPTNTDIPHQGPNEGPFSLYIDWSQTINCTQASGGACNGGSVTFTDALSKTYTCTTEANGSCVAVVNQYRLNNDTGANGVEDHNPMTLTVSSPGCTTSTQTVTVSGTATQKIVLPGC